MDVNREEDKDDDDEPLFCLEPRISKFEDSREMNDVENNDNDREPFVLFPFQEKAVKWMIDFESSKNFSRGGILSMPMGSGKTEIVLDYICKFKTKSFLTKFFLILCPTSLVKHWNDRLKRREIEKLQVLCLGFDEFKTDRERDSKLFSFVDVWIIDEAHHLKNEKTILHSCFREEIQKNNKSIVWLITATPFVNSIFDVENLATLCFVNSFEQDSIKSSKTHLNSILYSGEKLEIDKQLNLPKCEDKVINVSFEFSLHKELYTFCKNVLSPKESLVHCEFLQRLGNHPFYLGTELWRNNRWNELLESKRKKTFDLQGYKRSFDPEIDIDPIVFTLIKKSCNLNRISELMDRRDLFFESEKFKTVLNLCIHHKEKVVIFSRFVWTLRLLQNYLQWNNLKSERIDGTCENVKRRNRKISKFKISKTKRILLCSVSTCGIGLDFSCCSAAILIEPFWNKSLEDQALYRVYRIGQLKPCFIYRLIQNDTTDDYISSVSDGKELSKFDFELLSRDLQ